MTAIAEIREEVDGTKNLPDYEAVDVLWVALLKVANKHMGKGEYERLKSLVASLPEGQVAAILNSGPANALLDLDPPLETILADQHERLDPEKTANAICQVREKRNADPRLRCWHLVRSSRGFGTSANMDSSRRRANEMLRYLTLREASWLACAS